VNGRVNGDAQEERRRSRKVSLRPNQHVLAARSEPLSKIESATIINK